MADNSKTMVETSAAGNPTDLEIMMYLDGELSGTEAERVQKFLSSDDEAKAKATSLGQMSELVQGSIELEADDAEHRLAGLWTGIDKAIHANGATADAPVKSVAPVKSASERAEEKATDALVQEASSGWLGAWQSHFITGAIVAAAVVLLMMSQRSDKPAKQTTVVRQAPPAVVMPVVLASQEPEVEELEVYDGSGVVMTIPGDDEVGGQSASTVIWISNDTDVMEDPI